MPKKTKAQKLKATRRPEPAQAAPAGAQLPGVGHYWTRADGLRLALVSEPTDEGVDVDLCVIDERRDGLMKFQHGTFPSAEALFAHMQESPFKWIRGDANATRKILAQGQRMTEFVGGTLPEGFTEFQEALGPAEKIQLPPGLYPCPACDTPLPPSLAEAVKDNAQTGIEVYLLCDRCRQKRALGTRRANYAVPMHMRLKNAFLESSELTLVPPGWDTLERALPTESAPESIGLLLVQDVVKGICYAIEKFVCDAVAPNPRLNDGHVLAALDHLKTAIAEDRELRAVEPYEVNFILEALDEGIALVKQIFREEVRAEPKKEDLLTAVEFIQISAGRRASKEPEKRQYVDFVCNYV